MKKLHCPLSFCSTSFAKPKSTSTKHPRSLSSRLSGFKSRWTMFKSWLMDYDTGVAVCYAELWLQTFFWLRFWSGRKCHLCNTNLLFGLWPLLDNPTSRTYRPVPRWHMRHSRWHRLPSVGPLTWSNRTGSHPDTHPLESRRTWRLWMFWKAEK